MKKIQLYAISILIAFFISQKSYGKDYICYYTMHVMIDHTLREHERQTDIRNTQAITAAQEENNKAKLNEVKEVYTKIRSRLNSLGFIFNSVSFTIDAIPIINRVVSRQRELINLASSHPKLAAFHIGNEVKILDKLQLLARFMTALLITYQDINQMKASDRKTLFDHGLYQLQDIYIATNQIYQNCQNYLYAEQLKKMEIKYWVNREKNMIEQIIQNAKNF